jgi:hypothetical protein
MSFFGHLSGDKSTEAKKNVITPGKRALLQKNVGTNSAQLKGARKHLRMYMT